MIKCKQCERISNCPYGIQDCESIISTCDEFSFNLIEHDSKLLDKVAEKLQEKICYENCGIRKCIFEKDECPWYRCVDEVIEGMKAEVEQWKK